MIATKPVQFYMKTGFTKKQNGKNWKRQKLEFGRKDIFFRSNRSENFSMIFKTLKLVSFLRFLLTANMRTWLLKFAGQIGSKRKLKNG